jgi:ATP-dependent protease ClpP protease subunit
VTTPKAGNRALDILDRRGRAAALVRADAARRHPFEVRNAAETTSGTSAAMYLYGVISAWGWGDTVSAKSVIKALADLDVDHLDVHIHSPGGDAFEGIAILNALRNHRADVTVHIDGIAASAASFIAMAGDEIVMGGGTEMMIHDASMLTYGNPEQLREDADWLDKQSQNIASIYAARAGGSAADWRALMQAETWYTADEAVAAGLADRVSGKAEPAEDPAATEVPEEGPDPMLEDRFDLSVFTYAGRANAPAPRLAAVASHPDPRPRPRTGSITEGGSAVAFSDEQMNTLRNRLGVTEDADEATILAALDEALNERAEQPQNAQVPEGMALVETTVLDELRNGARQGTEARQRQLTEDRDRAIEDAIRTGRTTPARREHWQNAWNADPDGTAQILASLAPGLVPVDELGHAGAVNAAAKTAADALYVSVFGDEKGA